MNENENLVAGAVTENVEHTTEQTPEKKFSQEELNEIVGKAKARERAKITKQYEREYGDLMATLEEGTGVKGTAELNELFTQHYTAKGRIKKKPTAEYSASDIETLAKKDAEEIISYGFDEVVEEADRLKAIGVERMTARDKAVFSKLAEYVKNTEQSRALAQIGVPEDVYNSKDFKEFQAMFTSEVPIEKVYDQYQKSQPKKEIRTMGSMKNSQAEDNGVKDYYSYEEAMKFTKADFDKNPALYKAVLASMPKWTN